MLKNAEYRVLEDQEILPEPRFVLSLGRTLDDLIRSAGRVGQIAPLVVAAEAGGFRLICGARRRDAFRAVGLDRYAALILPEATPALDLLTLALEDNLTGRGLNDGEKVMAVGYLGLLATPEESLAWLPRLGLPQRPDFLERYQNLNRLGPDALVALAQGEMDPESAEMLLPLEPADRRAAVDLIDELRPGRNKRRELLTLLIEIQRREKRTLADVLADPAVESARTAADMGRPDREKAVRGRLRAIRYPEWTRLMEQRSRLLQRLGPQPGLTFRLPDHFEGVGFEATLHFQNQADFRQLAQRLGQLADHPDLAALLELG